MSKNHEKPQQDTLAIKVDHEIKIMRLSDLVPSPYNPRKITSRAKRALGASLRRFGVVEPIVVNRRGMRIVGGHQRYEQIRLAGVKEAQVVLVELDENDEKALNVTLNSPEAQGAFDIDALADIVDELKEAIPDVTAELRIDALAIADLLPSSAPPSEDPDAGKVRIIVTTIGEEQFDAVKPIFDAMIAEHGVKVEIHLGEKLKQEAPS